MNWVILGVTLKNGSKKTASKIHWVQQDLLGSSYPEVSISNSYSSPAARLLNLID